MIQRGTYHRPTGLEAALTIRTGGKVTVAAGCTDLFPATQAQELSGDILDITAIEALKRIEQVDGFWRIGAAVTWSQLVATPLPAAFDGLKLAAIEVGSIQIQNAATLAGNICNASPAADGVPCLLTLDAQVELTSQAGCRQLALADFIQGPRRTALRSDEILTSILVPESAAQGQSRFLKLGARKYLVISIAMVASRIVEKNGLVESAAIAVGSCSAVARRLPDLEAELQGKQLGQVPAALDVLVGGELAPIDDIRADAAYRRQAATEMVSRVIQP